MHWILVSILGMCTILLGAIALYFWATRRASKGRVAAATISSIVTLFFVWLSSVSIDTPTLIFSLLQGHSIEEGLAFARPSFSYFIFSISAFLVSNYLIFRFGSTAISTWDGPITLSVAELEETGLHDSIIPLAYKQFFYSTTRRIDPVVGKGNEPIWSLSDPPSEPPWRAVIPDLMRLENRDIEISDDGWSDSLNCWVGQIEMPGQSEHATPVYVLALQARPTIPDLKNFVSAIVRAESSEEEEPVTLIACVDSEEIMDEIVQVDKRTSVRVVSKGSLLYSALDFRVYCRKLIRRFAVNKDIDEPDGEPECVSDVISSWIGRESKENLSIVGEFGQGKSTALLEYCVAWAKANLEGSTNAGRVPLLIELRGRSPCRQGPAEFLNEWGMRYDLNGEALYNLVRAGKALLIFEGFDEVQDAGRRFDRFRQFDALWHFSYPGTKIIFTGRPNFFLDEPELLKLLRIERAAASAGKAYTTCYHLSFLEIEQVRSALRGFDETVVEEICRACLENENLYDIARRPSMLPVIGSQWKSIKESYEGISGISSGKVIKYFISFLYQRKEGEIERDVHERGLPISENYQLLPRSIRQYFTLGVVRFMASQDAKNTISAESFEKVISTLYDSVEAVFRSEESDGHYALFVQRLRARFAEYKRRDIVSTVATEVRTNGIFARDPAGGPSNLYLPHKQYYEYLIAEGVLATVRDPNSVMAEAITKPSRFGKSVWMLLYSEVQAAFHLADLLSLEEFHSKLWPNRSMPRASSYAKTTCVFVSSLLANQAEL